MVGQQSGQRVDWMQIPPGVPYLEVANPAPSQFVMDNMIANQGDGTDPNQGALVPANQMRPPGAEVPESLSQFKVLSVEIIDRIWASLKQMVEEDTADLVRRQRQRDEKWRLLMKLRPPEGGGRVGNHQFAQMYANEVQAKLAREAPPREDHPLSLEAGVPSQIVASRAQSRHDQQNDQAVHEAQMRQQELQKREEESVARRQSEWSMHLESEVGKLRELITQQQQTLLAQQQALSQATGALEEARQDKEEALRKAVVAAEHATHDARIQAASEARLAAEQHAEMKIQDERHAMQRAMEAQVKIAREVAEVHSRQAVDYAAEARGPAASGDNNPEALSELLQNEALRQQLVDRLQDGGQGGNVPGSVSAPVGRRKPASGQGRRPGKMATCQRCKKPFNLSENNNPRACRYHKGRWVTAPNKGKSGVLANAAMQLVMGPEGRYKVDDQRQGKWSCCGSKDPDDPGCVSDVHIAEKTRS